MDNIKDRIPVSQGVIPTPVITTPYFLSKFLIGLPFGTLTMPPRTRRSQQSGSQDPSQGPSDENTFHLQSPSTPARGDAVRRASLSTTPPSPVVQTSSESNL